MLNTKSITAGLGAFAALCSVAGGVCAITAATTVPAMAQQDGGAAPPPGGGIGGWHRHNHHPEINAAIRHLNLVIKNLSIARHDYDGHRVKALQLAQQALAECQAALQTTDGN